MRTPPAPLIVNVALTGAVPTKGTSPHVPLSAQEILADVEACRAAGACVFHVHARDAEGLPTCRAEAVAPIVEGIRSIDPDLVVCVTTSGRRAPDLAARAEVLWLSGTAKPDMASLTLGSSNFAREASVNPPEAIRELASIMRDQGIQPEAEVFEPGMLHFAQRLVDEGLLPERCYVNVLLGSLGTAPLSAASLAAFLACLPAGWVWGLGGIGRYQLDATLLALALADGVRVGLEDTVWMDRAASVHATNEDLVRRVERLAALADRPLASPQEARRVLGLARRTSDSALVGA